MVFVKPLFLFLSERRALLDWNLALTLANILVLSLERSLRTLGILSHHRGSLL